MERAKHGDTVKINFTGESLNIEANCDKLERVLTNLIDNACDAVGETGSIEIHARAKESDNILITITDDGPGIPDKILSSLFEPFVTKDKKMGTGLGLAIAKRTVQQHHGQIWVESQTEKGTTFYIQLPMKQNS